MERNSELSSQRVALLYLLLCLVPETKYKGRIYLCKLFEGILSIMVGKEWQLLDGQSMCLTETPHLLKLQRVGPRDQTGSGPGIYFLPLRLHLSKVPQPTQTATPAGDQESERLCLQEKISYSDRNSCYIATVWPYPREKGVEIQRPSSYIAIFIQETFCNALGFSPPSFSSFYISRGLASGKVLCLSQPSQGK